MANQYAALVVEDEALVRLDLATTLEDAGYLIFEQLDTHVDIGIHKFASWYFTDATARSLHPLQ